MKKKYDKRKTFLILILIFLYVWVFPIYSSVYSSGLLALGERATAEDSEKKAKVPHIVPRIDSKIRIDGVLDEKVWQEALKIEIKYEFYPGYNTKPPVRTEVFLAYGANHLYAGFRAYDSKPGEIRARVTDRDNIENDDYVAIVLDTFNESRRAYVIRCNPHGVQHDFITTMETSMDEWDGIWSSAGKISEWGYTVEMKIPFSTLRFQKTKDNQVWGFDAIRHYPRSLNRYFTIFSRDRSNNCYMCQADKIIGFKGARAGLNLEFDPTLSAILTQERESFPDGEFKDVTKKLDPGISARWSFTPNLTLSGAVNPDFSHVEADAAQLDINNQFILFYPEKRPFFLEGLNIFRSRLYPVYTRSIVDPNWGIKMTGKEGKNTIGFYSAQDSVTNLVFPGSEGSRNTSLGMNNYGTVFRYRRDVGRSSNLGLFVTDREGKDYFNRVAGIDGDLRFTKKDSLLFQFLGSQTQYPGDVILDFGQPLGKFTGGAFDCLYSHATEHVRISAHYQDIGPDFRADLGFVGQTGFKLYEGAGQYIWRRNPGHWYTAMVVQGGYSQMFDYNKNPLQKVFESTFSYEGPLQSLFNLHITGGKRTFMGQEFNHNTLDVIAQLRPSGSFFLYLVGIFGDQVDYANLRAGKRITLNPGIEYHLGNHLSFSIEHLYEKLDVDAGKLYTANLTNFRMVYQFSNRAFLRTILQYADFRYNTDLYITPPDPEFKHLFSQVLFSYKINPQTVLFLGYSDDYYGYSIIPVTQNNRTFFLKIGYALVL